MEEARQLDWIDILGWTADQVIDVRVTGYSYIRQGKYDIALKFFKALCHLDNNNVYDLQTLGAIYLELGEAQSALEYLSQALSADPSHPPTRLNRAKALLDLGRKDEALRIAKSLLKHEQPSISMTAAALLSAYRK